MEPEYVFASSVVQRVDKKKETVGRSELNDVEKAIMSVWVALGLVGNGGLQYWLLSSHASPSIVGELEKMDLRSLSAVMDRVFHLLPNVVGQPESTKERIIKKNEKQLDELTSEWYQAAEGVETRIANYMRTNWDFLRETITEYYAFWL